MDISQLINNATDKLRAQVLSKDSNSTVTLRGTPIKSINNIPMSQPIADIEVITGGKTYLYNIYHNGFTGELKTTPVFQG